MSERCNEATGGGVGPQRVAQTSMRTASIDKMAVAQLVDAAESLQSRRVQQRYGKRVVIHIPVDLVSMREFLHQLAPPARSDDSTPGLGWRDLLRGRSQTCCGPGLSQTKRKCLSGN